MLAPLCDLCGEVEELLELNLLEASSATTSFFFGGTTRVFILACDGRWRTNGLAELLVTSLTLQKGKGTIRITQSNSHTKEYKNYKN